jgi:hypothetical protein
MIWGCGGMGVRVRVVACVAALALLVQAQMAWGWGAVGHTMINRLAAENLPQAVPAFLRTGAAIDAMGYYGPEPDRWKGRAEPELNSEQSPDHFIDMEYAALVGPLPHRRYDFISALAKAQAAHPDLPLTPGKVGMQPWQVDEVYERLQSGLREYRRLVAANENTHPAEAEVLFYAGWLGHYVADGSQPLHTTIQYNGWTGPNPNHYTTEHTIHAQFESTYVGANVPAGEVNALVEAAPAQSLNGDIFDDYMVYLRHTNSLVERVYQIDKTGGFTGAGTPEAKQFTEERLAAGAIELRNLIYTAWLRSGEPVPPYTGPQ